MIYEMRTYDLKPGSLTDAIKRFAEAYENRKKVSELAAFWHTELGPLNQLIYVWPYQDLADRARLRATAGKDPNWPPRLAQFSAAQRSEIFVPLRGSPELKPGKIGPVFEMRTYTVAPGDLPLALENWETALPGRNALRPACAVWYTEVGALNKLVHIWSYESFEQRDEIRKQAVETGNWPPTTMAKKEGRRVCAYTSQENKFLKASAFSPVQ
jgi:NIPSNAP